MAWVCLHTHTCVKHVVAWLHKCPVLTCKGLLRTQMLPEVEFLGHFPRPRLGRVPQGLCGKVPVDVEEQPPRRLNLILRRLGQPADLPTTAGIAM